VAMIVKSQPGAELSCRAQNYSFDQKGVKVERGVISYYAAQTLPRATTMESWLQLINESSDSDLNQGRLKRTYKPLLQIHGDQTIMAPGKPVSVISKRE
jgi:hypothetical protein